MDSWRFMRRGLGAQVGRVRPVLTVVSEDSDGCRAGRTPGQGFQHRLCRLVLIEVRADGRKELVTLADGYRESTESWADLLGDAPGGGWVPRCSRSGTARSAFGARCGEFAVPHDPDRREKNTRCTDMTAPKSPDRDPTPPPLTGETIRCRSAAVKQSASD